MDTLAASEEKQIDFELSEIISVPDSGEVFGVVKTLVSTNSPGSSSYQPIEGALVKAEFASGDPTFIPWPVQ